MHVVGVSGQPAFAGAWVNFDALRPVAFYRNNGRVYVRGLAKSGVIGNPIFTLPSGYWPDVASDVILPCVSNGAFGGVTVSTAGVVTCFTGNNAYVDLSSISFRHA